MTNKPDFTAFLQTQGNARRFSAPLAYMKFMDGSHVGAIFLEHMLFWYSKGGGKDGWFYKSAKEWYAETGLSTDSVKRYTKMLVQLGVLETKLYPANGAPTTHFRLDAEKLYTILVEALSNQAEDDGSGAHGKTTISHWLETPNAFDDTDKTIWAKPQKEKKGEKQQEKPEPFAENPKSITAAEYTLKSKQEAISFRNRGELENPSSCPTPEIVSPLSVSELEPALQNSNGVMSTGYVEQVKVFDVEQEVSVILPPNATYPVTVKVQNAPVAAQVFAEILPAEPTPVTVKSKPKKAAAKPKVAKPPKASHVFTQGELALIAELEAIDPNVAEAARGRCGGCRASDPWLISQIFLVTKARVPQLLWTDVAAVIGKSLDVKLLLTVYKAWVGKHIDPYNFGWLLEWYKAGGPPQYVKYGQQQAQQQPTSAPSKPKVEFDDPLVIGSTQWVMNTPGYGSMSPNSIRLGMWMAANNNEQYMFHLAEAPELLAKYLAEKGQEYAG